MIILNYHEISAGQSSHAHTLSRRAFEAQIDALIGEGFSFVTLADLISDPGVDRPCECAVTFDDGRLGAYRHGSPVLRERGIRASYFICTDWLERKPRSRAESYSEFMTWEHVGRLAAEGDVVGSHGRSHVSLVDVPLSSAALDLAESKAVIERRTGRACEHFAAPWGQINRAIMGLVRDCGYRTLSSTVAAPNKVPYELLRLRRVDASACRTLQAFRTAVGAYVEAHSRFEVARLKIEPKWRRNAPDMEAIARFDLAVCLDDRAYELCLELGLPCLRHRPESAQNLDPPRELLLTTHGRMARDREMTFTPVTLRERRPSWTYLSSFLPGTNRTR